MSLLCIGALFCPEIILPGPLIYSQGSGLGGLGFNSLLHEIKKILQ